MTAHVVCLHGKQPTKTKMKQHSFKPVDPVAFDTNCQTCAGKRRDSVHGEDRFAELPAFRVIYEDGESYITSMAHGVTLADARAYFVGQTFTQADEQTKKTVATVEQVGGAR